MNDNQVINPKISGIVSSQEVFGGLGQTSSDASRTVDLSSDFNGSSNAGLLPENSPVTGGAPVSLNAHGDGVQMALAFSKRVACALEVFGKTSRAVAYSFERQTAHYLIHGRSVGYAQALVTEVDYLKRAKLFTCFFMARMTKTRMVDFGYKPSGSFGTWSRPRLAIASPKNVMLWNMVFLSKKASEHLTWISEDQNIRDHGKTMAESAKVVHNKACEDAIFASLKPILRKLREGVLRRFKQGGLFDSAPSYNGALDTPKTGGGAHCTLGDQAFYGLKGSFVNRTICRDTSKYLVPGVSPHRGPETCGLTVPEFEKLKLSRRPEDVARVREAGRFKHKAAGQSFFPMDMSDQPDLAWEAEAPVFSAPELEVCSNGWEEPAYRVRPLPRYPGAQAKWEEEIFNRALDDAEVPFPKVKYCCVVEPLKVRGITVSDASGTYCLKWLQQEVVKILGQLPCFPSMTRSVDGSDVTGLLWFAKLLPGDPNFGSSDFKGATDGLSHELSDRILADICSLLPEDWQVVAMHDNKPHRVFYPKIPELTKTGEFILYNACHEAAGREYVDREINGVSYQLLASFGGSQVQCQGNLMGQITSFFLLCLINLGCHLATVKDVNVPVSYGDSLRSVIINGDDRLAYSSREFEARFWQFANGVGLYESPGKSYVHPRYGNINSQSYWLGDGHCFRIRVPNLGLFFGKRKLAGDKFEPTAVFSALMETIPDPLQAQAGKLFLSRFKAQIKVEANGRNLFLPYALGGLGQKLPSGFKTKITNEQYYVACLASESTQFRCGYGPAPGPYVPKPLPEERPAWAKDRVQMVFDPECGYDADRRDGLKEFEARFKNFHEVLRKGPGGEKLTPMQNRLMVLRGACPCCGDPTNDPWKAFVKCPTCLVGTSVRLELNLTRTELLNSRFGRCYSPHGTLPGITIPEINLPVADLKGIEACISAWFDEVIIPSIDLGPLSLFARGARIQISV
jgi:hypothetical protein